MTNDLMTNGFPIGLLILLWILLYLFMVFQTIAFMLIVGFDGHYEVQIPFDSAGKVYEIDSSRAEHISILAGYPGLQKALLFLQPDSSFVIEVCSKKDGTIIKERIPVQQGILEQIKEEISRAQQMEVKRIVYDRSGYKNFLFNSFVFSYAIQAPLLAWSIQPDDFRTGLAIYMLSSASGFIIPLLLTKNCDVTKAHASMFAFGGIHGLYIAGALSTIADINFYEDAGAFFTVGGSVIGEVLGFQSVNRYHLSMGRGDLIGLIGDFTGIGAVGLLRLSDDWDNERFNYKHYLATSIAGFGVGLAGGAVITRKLDLADGDPIIFGHCGIIGAGLLPLIVYWFDDEYAGSRISGKVYISAGIAGLGLGSTLGYNIVKKRNFTEGNANIITLGGVAGALTGLGLVYLAGVENQKVQHTTLLLGDIVGALATSSFIKAGNAEGESQIRLHPESIVCLGLSTLHIPNRGPIVSFNF